MKHILDLTQEPQHIPALAAWHHAEWAHLNPGRSLRDRVESMQHYLDDGLVPSTFICKCDGQLAGSAAIVDCDMDTHPEWTPWLASVFVAPAFRRRGLGSELVRYLMLRAQNAGIENLYLFTPDRAAFYHKLGWRLLGEEDYRTCRVSVMQICLRSHPVQER